MKFEGKAPGEGQRKDGRCEHIYPHKPCNEIHHCVSLGPLRLKPMCTRACLCFGSLAVPVFAHHPPRFGRIDGVMCNKTMYFNASCITRPSYCLGYIHIYSRITLHVCICIHMDMSEDNLEKSSTSIGACPKFCIGCGYIPTPDSLARRSTQKKHKNMAPGHGSCQQGC